MAYLQEIVNSVSSLIWEMPYFWIFVFMTIESSFIPFPSEVVMIPAWYLAATGKISFFFGFLAGLGGSMLWATINYYIGYFGGKKIITKIIGEKNNNLCVAYFDKYGDHTTLIGRFIPGVRQIISLPAGVFKMNLQKFMIYTAIWAGIWALILMLFGYFIGENKELFFEYKYYLTAGTIVLVVLLIYLKIQLLKYFNRGVKITAKN